MLLHLNVWMTAGAALLTILLSVAGAVVAVGIFSRARNEALSQALKTADQRADSIQKSLDENLVKTATALKKIDNLNAQHTKLSETNARQTQQLGMTIRIIHYFEMVIAIYIKSRSRIPSDICNQIDDILRDLRLFRHDADLELAAGRNVDYYDSLLLANAISGPAEKEG